MSERKYDKLLTAAELKQHVDLASSGVALLRAHLEEVCGVIDGERTPRDFAEGGGEHVEVLPSRCHEAKTTSGAPVRRSSRGSWPRLIRASFSSRC